MLGAAECDEVCVSQLVCARYGLQAMAVDDLGLGVREVDSLDLVRVTTDAFDDSEWSVE